MQVNQIKKILKITANLKKLWGKAWNGSSKVY